MDKKETEKVPVSEKAWQAHLDAATASQVAPHPTAATRAGGS